ncbi:DEHA2D18392p [Debaryomyces hansenii CBS767]|uniref:DEHA2D18392p n=1 Tax=Debaryomyces hansenii (strain ATCC 36239 / CBS 767 / BCRC 21394 / JCM 1990 / NBRC 0083 / IGC 2968) TaxID=284592 RepID=B5RTM1_DEBHA|nr:DEHA2D18392p [Debaryomyces hansenii CBS767]CAR65704.1 DEHA2D18392p [Debaryomyces hansenii CBS767]|eukprot:XP_002770350.1 DEHA2D18392p [Debaryomyces hansenii CBS767]
MGVCLSCLRGDYDDDEINETTSLLGHGIYSDENYQEELLKQQQRQNELNVIVNELNDNLIDVSTFLNKNSFDQTDYPVVMSDKEKLKIVDEIDNLDVAIKKSCQVEVKDPLYLKF